MAQGFSLAAMVNQLDQFNEYDREPIQENQLKSGKYFASLFGGEHVAGTEFVIGAFFVLNGISARDLLIGLLIGNLLAVLSWTFVCAPIAVQVRLTLYWYLRKIGGPGVMVIYNIANAFLYCILAGAMISVSTTAVGIAFNIQMPTLQDVYPSSVGWVLVVLLVGAVSMFAAIFGFKWIGEFSRICVPWMFLVFIAGAVAVLPQLGEIRSFGDFWQIAQTKIWNGIPAVGREKMGLWHVIFFAWFCNLAMHICLSDMALFRFAKHWACGLYSAVGMYLGHFIAWICSGIMVAAYGAKIEPGPMAYNAVGFAGALAVVLAGMTTANPTIYRAGLALQIVTPNWPRWLMTIIAFMISTFLGLFPFFVMKLLDFVAVYGLILMPVGAIVFAEHWLFPRLGLKQYWAEAQGVIFNIPALITWLGVLLICFFPMSWLGIHLFFRWLPGYFLSLIAYIALSYAWAKK